MSLDRFQTATIDLLNEIATKLENRYTSIAGTLYQNVDNTVQVVILSNTSPYGLTVTGDENGQITFSTDGDADLRKTLIFLGPPSYRGCVFEITNVNDSPLELVIKSRNVITEPDELDRRGFGALGVSPTSFELRFYPEV
jgi:hypothetical protein